MTINRTERTEDLLADTVLSSRRPKLVLSPHLDDALLSAYAVVASGPCEVWTVFAGRPSPAQTTSWDRSCGFPDSDHTMTARLAEDESAFRGTSASVRRLPALDGAYTTPERRRSDLAMIRADLDAWMTEHPDAVIIAPVGAGLHVPPAWWQLAKQRVTGFVPSPPSPQNVTASSVPAGSPEPSSSLASSPAENQPKKHEKTSARALPKAGVHLATRAAQLLRGAMHADAQRRRRKVLGENGLAANPDHLDVRDLVLDVSRQHPSVQVVLFEDLPYLWHERGASEATRLGTAGTQVLRSFTVEIDPAAKFAHLEPYVSQMPVMDSAGRLLQASTLPPSETYWIAS